jgi:hypothetical protein
MNVGEDINALCIQYYEIILMYYITFAENNLIIIFVRNNTFVICLP